MMCRFRSLLLACCLGLVLGLAACAPPQADPHRDLSGLAGKTDPAAEMLFAKAHVLWRGTDDCSDPRKAVEYLDQTLHIDPDFTEALMWRGMALSQMGEWDAALDDLTAVVRAAPSAEAYARRGLAFFRTGNFMGSRMDLDRSIKLDASQHRAWNFRGALNLHENNTDAACADFSRGCRNGDCTGLESARELNMCK